MPTETQQSDQASAFDALRRDIQSDHEYAWSWHCNLATPIMDNGQTHSVANHAAARIMQHVWGVDVTQSPEWKRLERQWEEMIGRVTRD